MKAHKPLQLTRPSRLSEPDSSSSSSDEEDCPASHGFRQNPGKSSRFGDPDVDSGSVVQDRESETESPTRRRSNRNRKSGGPNWAAGDFFSPPESSVSDGSPEENVAVCLMMLSRDRWLRKKPKIIVGEEESKSSESSKIHRVTHKKFSGAGASKIYECSFCLRIFGSGQALGGHKRSHTLGSSSNAASSISPKKLFVGESSIDLNLPAPVEEDSYSVVSDAEFVR